MTKIFFYLALLPMSINADTDSNLSIIALENEEFRMWLALFGLAIVALLALFLSSIQIRSFKKKIQEENDILSTIGKDIQNIATENVDIVKKLSQTNEIDDIHQIEDSETHLLSIATNLIEFLRIKSNKIEIHQERFLLSNLFNDVTGTLKDIFNESPLELHYLVENNHTEDIYADTLHLSKVLVNIILFSKEHKTDKAVVTVKKSDAFSMSDNLFFSIKTNIKIDVENKGNIFNSSYNEKTGTYDNLTLFIAKKLCNLMGGELVARDDEDGNLEFLFDITYKENIQDIDTNKVSPKKILIVDSSNDSAFCTKNIFENLQHHVSVKKATDYLDGVTDFSIYDIVILDEILCNKKPILLHNSNVKFIFLSNLFGPLSNHIEQQVNNLVLKKPLTKKQVQESLEDLYANKETTSENTHITKLPIHRDIFKNYTDVTLEKFSEFRDTSILLVEDNFINQKVLLGILGKSAINITVANNGQEALDILEKEKTFNIVLMDINMPVMDGYTATKHIRTNKEHDQLPIIALTALTSKSEIDSMFNSGMNAYLAKPLKKEKLFSALAMFITNKKENRRKTVRYEERTMKLDGLNIELGIQNSNSNDFFYQEILSEFIDAYGDSDKIFMKLVNDYRFEQLRMLCLDVRGLSASIGAEDMNELSTEVLKLLLFKKYDILQDFIPLYTKALNRLSTSIKKYISN